MKFTDRLNMLIGGESSAPKKATSKFTPALNNIMSGGEKSLKKAIPKYTPKAIPASNIMPMKKKPAMKQYGDKGYKPATGEKTGM